MPVSNSLNNLKEVLRTETCGINLRYLAVIFLIEALVIALIGILHKRNNSYRKLFLKFLIAAYFTVLLSITLFRRPWGSRQGIVHLDVYLGLGIRSGHPSSLIIVYGLYNILLFIPLGSLLYLLFDGDNNIVMLIRTTLITFVISLLIECTQFLTGRGMFEVTDLLTNTFGGFVGAVLAAIFLLFYLRRRQ